jgi:TRAP-type C4-dicarboxylate transport system substrate-binding protein
MALLAVASLWLPDSAYGQEKLIFATDNSNTSTAAVRVFHPWADKINADGKGIVDIDVRDGFALVNHTNVYARVLDDVVQISSILFGFVGGKFPQTEFASLPFEAETAEDASVALWQLYKSGALDSEFDEIQPLFMIVGSQQGIQLDKKPKTLESLNGLKIITPGKISGETVTALGGSPMAFAPADLYTALQRGTADGALYPFSAFQSMRLGELTTFHVDAPLGSASGAVFMSKKRYAALSPTARKLIDENSGEAESRFYGHHLDLEQTRQRAQVASMSGQQVVELTREQRAIWQQRVSIVQEQWEKATPQGAAILGKFRSLLAQVLAEKKRGQ